MQFNLQQVLTGVLALLSVTAAAAWYVRGERIEFLQQELATYKNIHELDLKKMAANAHDATTSLSAHTSTLGDLTKTKEELAKIKVKVSQYENMITIQKNKIIKSNSQISILKNKISGTSMESDTIDKWGL